MTRVVRTTEAKHEGDQASYALYDKEAERYDRLRYESAEGRFFNDLELRLLHESIPLGLGSRLLDVPTGTGRLSVALAATEATIVGGDLSQGMLRVASKKATAKQLENVAFTQLSGDRLPFGDDTFDAVISFKFFHLVPNDLKPIFVREMTRVLKPGGALVVEFNSPFYGGILSFLRYYFQKKRPGGMRMKCLFPDQVRPLFKGLQVTRIRGVKLPMSGRLQALFGTRRVATVNHWFGKLPGIKYLSYAIVVEARKR